MPRKTTATRRGRAPVTGMRRAGGRAVRALVGATVLACVTAGGIGAQTAGPGNGVGGRWQAEWASGVRHEADGTVTVQRRATAELVLEVQGDSVHGTWTFELDGRGRSAWYVRGTATRGRLNLVSTEADIENPPSGARVTRQTWSATLEGDRLEGEHWMYIGLPDGRERASGPRPWSAIRGSG